MEDDVHLLADERPGNQDHVIDVTLGIAGNGRDAGPLGGDGLLAFTEPDVGEQVAGPAGLVLHPETDPQIVLREAVVGEGVVTVGIQHDGVLYAEGVILGVEDDADLVFLYKRR